MDKLKNIALRVLINEGMFYEINSEQVGKVVDIKFDDNDIIFFFDTAVGEQAQLVVKTKDFQKWVGANRDKASDLFQDFVKDFLNASAEGDESLNEIVDDDGNIMPDDDMPSNSTNSMVVGPRFDLEKIYRSFVPKSIRFYSGDLGIGIITW